MREPSSEQDRLAKLAQLGERVKTAQQANEPEIDDNSSGWAVGVNYASAFAGSVVVAGGLGFCLDYFAHTKPWGLMAGILIGFIAGTRSIVQMAKKMSEQNSES